MYPEAPCPSTRNLLGSRPYSLEMVPLGLRYPHSRWSVMHAYGRHCESRSLCSPWTRLPSIPVHGVQPQNLQGCLAHEQVPPPRTPQWAILQALRWSTGGRWFLLRVVHLHSRITTRTTLEHCRGPFPRSFGAPPVRCVSFLARKPCTHPLQKLLEIKDTHRPETLR